MKHIGNYPDAAKRVEAEIIADFMSDWYQPIADTHEIFDQAFMKFLNRNLNYFSFENMLAAVVEGDELNSAYPYTIMWCNNTRKMSDVKGPFGRMCIWRIPPGSSLLPHRDSFKYHYQIVRNIFVVKSSSATRIAINGKDVSHSDGTYFQFFPAVELHSFENHGTEDFYFLGYDFWYPEKFTARFDSAKVKELLNNSERHTGYGAINTNKKFMSQH